MDMWKDIDGGTHVLSTAAHTRRVLTLEILTKITKAGRRLVFCACHSTFDASDSGDSVTARHQHKRHYRSEQRRVRVSKGFNDDLYEKDREATQTRRLNKR